MNHLIDADPGTHYLSPKYTGIEEKEETFKCKFCLDECDFDKVDYISKVGYVCHECQEIPETKQEIQYAQTTKN